ncbi:hypothetical protein Tco_0508515 [Tanacetum coccineum]
MHSETANFGRHWRELHVSGLFGEEQKRQGIYGPYTKHLADLCSQRLGPASQITYDASQFIQDDGKDLRRLEYGVSTSIGYGVSSSLSNTAYSSQLINTAYPPPLDTAYRSSETETEILVFLFDFRPKFFLPFFRANPADIFALVTGRTYQS